MDELTLGDKIYISSKRAAEITGYAKDYVGQLCREGHVEAKMVGRSWYVLESSIREHRFGQEESKVEEPTAAPQEAEARNLDTWEAPRYVAEEPNYIPPMAERPKEISKADLEAATAEISDMQAAWKEWFEHKQIDALPAPEAEPLLESPEIIDARDRTMQREDTPEPVEAPTQEESPVEVPFTRIEQAVPLERESEAEEIVPIRTIRSAPSLRRISNPAVPRNDMSRITAENRERGSSNIVLGAVLIALAVAFIAIGAIGSGFADHYTTSNPVLKYLGGTSTVNNQ